MQRFYAPDISPKGIHQLDKEEAKHCLKVLRKQIGDQVELVDGQGTVYTGEIQTEDIKDCQIKILTQQENYGKRSCMLTIAIAPPKNRSRLEWFLEKATEIGIDEIIPVITRNSERKKLNCERMNKILVGAMKQSRRAYLPKLKGFITFQELITQYKEVDSMKFIATCDFENASHLKEVYEKGGDVLILIGPEGDFSPKEVEMALDQGFVPISLGQSRLRVETAGLVACNIVNLINQ